MGGERNKTVQLLVGLGNPGEKYAETRHNAGFAAVDRFLKTAPKSFTGSTRHRGELWTGRFAGHRLLLLKPMTYMNLSGECVAGVCRDEKLSPEDVLVVYDDMDIALGRIRFRFGGTSAGHRGIDSLIAELGSADFWRLRVGIGREPSANAIDHVLSAFSQEQARIFAEVIASVVTAVKFSVRRGLEAAMNEYNGKTIVKPGAADTPSREGGVDRAVNPVIANAGDDRGKTPKNV